MPARAPTVPLYRRSASTRPCGVTAQAGVLPMTDTNGDVTQLLNGVRKGERAAVDALLPVVYNELRRIAASYVKQERGDLTLQPTALVHEAYLRLVDQRDVEWQSRAHFLAVAA